MDFRERAGKPPPAGPFLAGAVRCSALAVITGAVLLGFFGDTAAAQAPDPDTPSLLSPRLDGGARRTSRFRQPASRNQDQSGPGSIGRLPTYGIPPASGAGQSGFNSTNRPRAAPTTARAQAPQSQTPVPLPMAVAPPPPPPAPPVQTRRAAPRRGAPVIVTGSAGAAVPYVQVPARRRSVVEEDPYEQLGWRAGAFIIRPAIELSTGYDSNPGRTSPARGSSVFVVAPELIVRSDWSRHQLNAELRGSYTSYPSASDFSRPSMDSKVDARVDVLRDTSIDMEGRLRVGTDNPGSPNVQADLTRLPINTTLGGTIGLTHRFSRLELTAKATADRTAYQDSRFTDGTTQSNEDRNFNQYGTRLRAGYELTPGIKPFVEGAFDRRVHDSAVDRNGFRRDSDGTTFRAGMSFDLPQRLTGEVAAGYTTRKYQDPSLKDLSGFIFDSSLVWTASGLTTVKLTATSAVNELITAGQSGVLARDVGVQIDHSFRRWLIGTVKLGAGLDDYIGSNRTDHRTSMGVGLTYKAARTIHIKGDIRQDWLRSNTPGNDYTATVFMLGLRFQQ